MHVTLWSSVLYETFVGPQLDKKIAYILENKILITMLLVPILSQMNLVHALQSYFFKILFNNSPPHMSVPSGLFLSGFTL
jgi:hypothetical protein